MAAGDFVWFRAGLLAIGNAQINLGSDTFKAGIVKSAANSGIDPSATTADPRWGSGGTTNLSSSQVATAAGYTGPVTLTSVTWSLVSNVPTLRGTIPTIPNNASGFTNGRWMIIYSDTDAGKRAIGYYDLGTDRSIAAGADLQVDPSGADNDIATIS